MTPVIPHARAVRKGMLKCVVDLTPALSLSELERNMPVYVKIDGDDILEDDRTETLTLMSGDDAISIGDPSELEIRVIDDDCELDLE